MSVAASQVNSNSDSDYALENHGTNESTARSDKAKEYNCGSLSGCSDADSDYAWYDNEYGGNQGTIDDSDVAKDSWDKFSWEDNDSQDSSYTDMCDMLYDNDSEYY